MTPAWLRHVAWTTGILLFAGVAALVVDWAIAAHRSPRNEQIIKALQNQGKEDAAIASRLEAEQKRITEELRERHWRSHAIGWSLLVCSAIFLASVKQIAALAGSKPIPMEKIAAASFSTVGKQERKGRCHCSAPAQPESSIPDLSFVDHSVAQFGSGKEAAIPLLQAIQQHYRYLPEDALRRLCEITQITPAEIAGTSSFYGQFRRSPVGRHIVRVCHGTACHVAGARQISEELHRRLQIPEGADTDTNRLFTIEEVACLGCCSLAPVLMVDEHTAGRLTPSTASAVLEEIEPMVSA